MAKAKSIADLDCQASALDGASRVLRQRFDEMVSFYDEALDPDAVDGIHDMRVASRRLRSALRDFAPLFQKKHYKPLKQQVKAVAGELGEVRDHDVAIVALSSLRTTAGTGDIAAGIDRLIEQRGEDRTKTHLAFVSQVKTDLLENISADLEIALNHNTRGRSLILFRSFAVEAIERAHSRFLERSESIYSPFDDTALHKLRLAAKRFRYALELFDKCWEGELKPLAKNISRIQSSLGEVHDSFEWIESLNRIISEDGDLGRDTASWLISEFAGRRTSEYQIALKLWNEWLTSDLSGQLRAIIRK